MLEPLYEVKTIDVTGEIQVLITGRKFLLVDQEVQGGLLYLSRFRVIEPIPLAENPMWLPEVVTLDIPVGEYLVIRYDQPYPVASARRTEEKADPDLQPEAPADPDPDDYPVGYWEDPVGFCQHGENPSACDICNEDRNGNC